MRGTPLLRAALGLVLALALLGLEGCGEETPSEPPVTELMSELAVAECEGLVACGLYPDAATCDAWTGGVARRDAIGAAVEQGTIVLNRDMLDACKMASGQVGCSHSERVAGNTASVCSGVLVPQVEVGGACTLSAECVSGVCVRDCPDGCCSGVCASSGKRAIGDACRGEECVDEGYCSYSEEGTTWGCDARFTLGRSCEPGDSCQKGLECVVVPDTEMWVCATLPSQGEPCVPANATICNTDTGACAYAGGSLCDRLDHFCDSVSSTCQPRLTTGSACRFDEECAGALVCSAGACAASPPPGRSSCP